MDLDFIITPEVQEIMTNTFHSFIVSTAALVSAYVHVCFAVLFPGLSCYRTDSLIYPVNGLFCDVSGSVISGRRSCHWRTSSRG